MANRDLDRRKIQTDRQTVRQTDRQTDGLNRQTPKLLIHRQIIRSDWVMSLGDVILHTIPHGNTSCVL